MKRGHSSKSSLIYHKQIDVLLMYNLVESERQCMFYLIGLS